MFSSFKGHFNVILREKMFSLQKENRINDLFDLNLSILLKTIINGMCYDNYVLMMDQQLFKFIL